MRKLFALKNVLVRTILKVLEGAIENTINVHFVLTF